MVADRAERDLAEELIAVGKRAVNSSLVIGAGGNLSARVPGRDRFIITAAGTLLDLLTPSDFLVMDLAGNVLGPLEGTNAVGFQASTSRPVGVGEPGWKKPSSEWKLHQRTYLVRADVNANVHLHPPVAVMLDAMGHRIRLITLEHRAYLGSVGHVAYHPNGSDELGDEAAEVAKEHNAMVLAHHGCSAIAEHVELAMRRAMLLEEAALVTYRLLTLGDTDTDFPEGADLTHA